jgi:hypothetical protein
MKSKIKPNGHAGHANANDLKKSEIAKLAGVTPQRVSQKLRQGKSVNQILKEAETRRQKQMLRQFPWVPVDSDEDVASSVTFARAQAAKEQALSELRRIEVLEKKGELIPVAYVRHWGLNFLIQGRQILEWGPTEMRDELAAETDPVKCEAIVRRRDERVLDAFHRLEVLWTQPPGKDGECPTTIGS